jgi:hypothetical protein
VAGVDDRQAAVGQPFVEELGVSTGTTRSWRPLMIVTGVVIWGRSSACAETTRYKPCALPGAAVEMFVPKWTDAADPGGVSWTTRNPLSKPQSASSRQPRPA